MTAVILKINDVRLDGSIRLEDGLAVVTISGDIDVYNDDVFLAVLESAEILAPSGIVVSFENVKYLSVRAVRILSEFGARVERTRGSPCVLLCPERHSARRMIDLLGYPQALVPDMNGALALLSERHSRRARSESAGRNSPSS